MAMTAAQLLDELMGKDRNLVPGEKSAQVPWDHTDVCRNYLCGFCPHDLFVNTKADLGACSKVHDDQLKTDYEKSSRYGRMGFEDEFIHYLSNIQADVDRKIRRGHERLMINQAREQEMSEKDTDKTKMLTDHIDQLLEEIEQLGSEGKVEEAQGVAKLVDQLKEEREQSKQNHSGVASQEKQMEVCEVCGAFLIVGDAQSRVDDHLQGKQHVGYAKIKSTIEDMKNRSWEKREKAQQEPTTVKKGDEEKKVDAEKKVDSERKSRDEKDKERRRDRSSDRKIRRSRSKSRERRRDRSKDRRREKSRERRRDRSRDRGRSDRDRDRDRDRRRDSRRSSRRSRSKSRDRRRRSRSRDRDEKRSRHSSRDRDRDRDRDRKERSSKDNDERRESKNESGQEETTKAEEVTTNGDAHQKHTDIPQEDIPQEKGITENSSIANNEQVATKDNDDDDETMIDEEIAMNY